MQKSNSALPMQIKGDKNTQQNRIFRKRNIIFAYR